MGDPHHNPPSPKSESMCELIQEDWYTGEQMSMTLTQWHLFAFVFRWTLFIKCSNALFCVPGLHEQIGDTIQFLR